MSDRNRFEAWYWERGIPLNYTREPEMFDRNEADSYFHRDVQFAWLVWQAAKADTGKGISVEECLPEDGDVVLGFDGKWQFAVWIRVNSVESWDEDADENETTFIPEGWYKSELKDAGGFMICVPLNVTHWKPLPPEPNSTTAPL